MNTVVIVFGIIFVISQAISIILGKIGHRDEDYWENDVCECIHNIVCIPVSSMCIVGLMITLIINYLF